MFLNKNIRVDMSYNTLYLINIRKQTFFKKIGGNMKLKKILTISLIASLAIQGLFALDATTTSTSKTSKTSNYVVNAKAEAISYTTKWYPENQDVALDEGSSIKSTDGTSDFLVDLLNESSQTSGNLVLKTDGVGNLNSDLPMSVKIVPTSFYEVDADGNKINGGFDTASSTTEFGYNFSVDNHKIYPVITMVPFTYDSNESTTFGVTYPTSSSTYLTYGKNESLIIGAGYHPSGLKLSRFNISVTGNKNVKAGSYKSDIKIDVIYN